MDVDIAGLCTTAQRVIQDVITAPPTLGLALFVFALHAIVAAGMKSIVIGLSTRYH